MVPEGWISMTFVIPSPHHVTVSLSCTNVNMLNYDGKHQTCLTCRYNVTELLAVDSFSFVQSSISPTLVALLVLVHSSIGLCEGKPHYFLYRRQRQLNSQPRECLVWQMNLYWTHSHQHSLQPCNLLTPQKMQHLKLSPWWKKRNTYTVLSTPITVSVISFWNCHLSPVIHVDAM